MLQPCADHDRFSWDDDSPGPNDRPRSVERKQRMAKAEYRSEAADIRKPQPASLSMFEWALTLEQERETVGAGR